MVASFVERRKGKVSEEDAQKLLRDVTYFGTMMVYMGLADGLVSGAVHSTGDTVRPALQIIKTKPGVSRTSGAFIMINSDKSKKYLFSDCAININPNAQELAEIAVESAKTAELFGIEPNVAMLSFSTKGSAKSEEALKVAEATKIAQELAPNYNIDGELQFDAAFVPSVGKQKAPDSQVAGQATVFVFPEIQSGNIGYKIAQRFGNFEAIGPILQGLNKPISDLSRGCNEEDVYKLAIITANQALMENQGERQKTKNDSQCESFLLRRLSPTDLIRCSRITSDEEKVNKLLCDARLRDFCDGELNYTKRLALRVVFLFIQPCQMFLNHE